MVYPGWEVGIITPSVNNSETVKAVTLAFCSIQQHFIRDICAKFGVPNWPQSPDIGQNSGGCISNFWISGQSLINKFCQEKIVKIDKRNTATLKKFDDDEHVTKLWHDRILSNLWPICSRLEAVISMHD